MFGIANLARWVQLAILVLFPLTTTAEVTLDYRSESGELVILGLDQTEISQIRRQPSAISLQLSGVSSTRSMLFRLASSDQTLLLVPRFQLKSGSQYELRLARANGEHVRLTIDTPENQAELPRVIGFSPRQAIIPANALRLYLSFSVPMARGQALDKIELLDEEERQIESPFLNLSDELWDAKQTRLTLLLDPGRIKQGVGPNLDVGAPLKEGHGYRLVISGSMESAAGKALGKQAVAAFRVGAPEGRAISVDDWQVTAPPARSTARFSVAFDRTMDRELVQRMLQLKGPTGKPVSGDVYGDGGGWSLAPHQAWVPGLYRLFIDHDLEDVSGNTMRTPFDARAGTIANTSHHRPKVIEVLIPFLKRHYYGSHETMNPTRIIPVRPNFDLNFPHNPEVLG